ncbi:MAG: ABC transporter permease subunit [bacterium]|nr:ABC transporter permease subunit [bacterium]
MSKVAAVWRREFKAFWFSPVAYIVIVVFLVVMSWVFFQYFFVQNDADMGQFFGLLPWAFLLILPALTMRQWAEERSSGTVELLMTKPVREWEAVFGKFLAGTCLLIAILLFTLPMTITVALLSQNGLDAGAVTASYLGALLLGMTYLAIGGWISALTNNQIVAFIISIGVIFLLIIIGEGFVTLRAPGFLVPVLEYLGLNKHYVSIARGVVDTRDLLYYFSMIFLFLYLTTRAVESRKWS